MKKFAILLLIAALLLLTACGAEEAAADEPSQYIGTWVSVAYKAEEGMSAIERGFEDALVLEIHEDGTYVFDPNAPSKAPGSTKATKSPLTKVPMMKNRIRLKTESCMQTGKTTESTLQKRAPKYR